jgi:hypothetical protein
MALKSTLHVNTITLVNISSLRQFEVSNYYVTLSYGIWKVSTTLNQNSGREICWKSPQSDLSMLFHVSIDELISQKFHVDVWNHDGNLLHGSGVCTLESSLKSITNDVICISIFLVDKQMKEFGIANILIHVVKSGFLSTHPTQPSSPSRLPLHPTVTIPNQSDSFQQLQSPLKQPHSPLPSASSFSSSPSVKASITQVNPDGTCTIRLENDEMKDVQFVTGRFHLPSQFKPGEHVNVSYPGSRSHSFPAVISRGHPDGTFTVRYHNGTREMRLNQSDIKKLTPSSSSASAETGIEEPKSVIAVSDLEKGCQTIEELNQRIPLYEKQAESLSQHLIISQQIFSSSLSSLSPPNTALLRAKAEAEARAETGRASLEERKRVRNEYFLHLQASESLRRSSLESRIEEMKRFSVPSQDNQHLSSLSSSHHLNLFHYSPLLFAPIRKELLSKYNSRKQRRQASFVIKRFFNRALAWVRVVLVVRTLTRNRLAFKKKDRREKAAVVIQCCFRQRYAVVVSMRRKFSALIIMKAMKNKRRRFLRRKELEDQLNVWRLVTKMQRLFRKHRRLKLEKIQMTIQRENKASLMIQRLFRQK